jgi:endonuclease/exonuclease/phosphatase family metal-dependent hydrolase
MSRLRVATYNVYLGADLSLLFDVTDLDELADRIRIVRGQLDATRSADRAQAVATLLARERPDLVGLQEVSRWVRTPIGGDEEVLVDFLPTLLAALEETGTPYDAHAVHPSFSGAMPVSDTEWVGLLGSNVTLVRRDGPVEVVAEHAAVYDAGFDVATGIEGVTFPIERGWGRVDVRVDGRPLRFVTTHTEAYDARVRAAQRDEVIRHNAEDGAVVLVGDLNAAPDAVGMPDGWTDAWSDGDGFTFGQAADLRNEESTMRERIDYVWVRGVDVVGARVVGDRPGDRTTTEPRLWPSDHAGVVVELDV